MSLKSKVALRFLPWVSRGRRSAVHSRWFLEVLAGLGLSHDLVCPRSARVCLSFRPRLPNGITEPPAKLVTKPSNASETSQPTETPRAAKSLWNRLSERRLPIERLPRGVPHCRNSCAHRVSLSASPDRLCRNPQLSIRSCNSAARMERQPSQSVGVSVSQLPAWFENAQPFLCWWRNQRLCKTARPGSE